MPALAAVAGVASAAQALAHDPLHAGQRKLSCGYDAIDAFLGGGFEAGQVHVLDGSTPLLWDLTVGALCQAAQRGTPVAVDGGNALDPYLIATHARRAGFDQRRTLLAVRLARAFTAHQLSTVLEETLTAELVDRRPPLVVVNCLPELYLDEDVPWVEANALVERAMALLRDAARTHGCAVLATNLGLRTLAARPALRSRFYAADRVVRLLPAGEGVVLEDLRAGTRALFRGPRRGQRTLANFDGPEERTPPLLAPQQLRIKGVA